MSRRCHLYYITDRTQFPGTEQQRRTRLLDKVAEATSQGVDYIQLREKDLSTHNLEVLAREVMDVITAHCQAPSVSWPPPTRLLINSRSDVAIAVHASGVHLRSDDISARDACEIWKRAYNMRSGPIVAVSCHSVAEVVRAQEDGADFAVFAPVFEMKGSSTAAGFATLRQACQHKIPVFALGGVTLQTASACLEAGAAGIAAIRLFQESDIGKVVEALRGLACS